MRVINMQKRILLFGNYPPPFGGVPTFIQYLADYLVQQDWNVHILSLTGKQTGIEYKNECIIHRPPRFRRWLSLLPSATKTFETCQKHQHFFLDSPQMLLGLIGITNYVR